MEKRKKLERYKKCGALLLYTAPSKHADITLRPRCWVRNAKRAFQLCIWSMCLFFLASKEAVNI